jgi:regulator of sirC expression with transglutaminase-like and TPR domain
VQYEDFEDFARAIRGADHEVDLYGAVMVIARLGGHSVDPHGTAARLDAFAETAREHAGEGATPDALAHAVDHQLFSVQGFHGNSDDYPDPANSYLDLVVERRVGIPITLSLVYMEVAQRIGLQCDGIGYPGHFFVRYGGAHHPVYVDPFQQGARIDRAELLARLRSFKIGTANPETFLAAVTRRQVLQRMLNNLHATFRDRRDLGRWYAVLELQLRLEPWNASLVGERGMLHYRLGRLEEAFQDLETYVSTGDRPETSPGAIRLLDQLRLRYGGTGEPR